MGLTVSSIFLFVNFAENFCVEESMNKTLADKIKANRKEYHRLLKDSDYTNVRFNPKNGALSAIHQEHVFDPKRGKYEIHVQEVGYKYGNAVVLDREPGNIYKVKYTDGTWNGKQFEISSRETATPQNIKKGLNHCAGKPNVKIAILYFPNDNFNIQNFERGLAMYNGIGKSGGKPYCDFEQIICIEGISIIYKKKPL